ncbi:GNAT family N-acetyltransferase [Enterococcus sp. DIV1298c]|uniref:GNAT family N-acetyltransferase n=1 Tax=Enterococcus sp. DIV1298c TaxID=2815328 RepID=UPI001A934C4A|nr:GNAT family N-acetyltransferase [Enterococcus sp. DIV1298c]MBO0462250.1 GNAT family N-acetyltransferase [Enterococcus sp. DIV1298c]
MRIREITPQDDLAIKEIIQNSLESLGLAIEGTAYFDPQLSHLSDYYQSLPHAAYWVVQIDDQVVGGVGIAPFDEQKQICELQKLYLAPEAVGLGIANQLMEKALSYAKQNYRECYLETMHALTPACKLYEKFGFHLMSAPLPGSDHSTMDAWYIKNLKKDSE